MDFSQYPKEIQELGNLILDRRYSNREMVMNYCNQMIDVAQGIQDHYLLGFAYYYLAENYFMFNDYTRFLEALTTSIDYQQRASQWRLLTRSYNMLGVSAYTQGNITVALDQYLTALKYCEEYDFRYEKAMVYTNIGHIYLSQRNYGRAIKYLSMGKELFLEEMPNPFAGSNMILADIAMGRCYLTSGEIEKADECEKAIEEQENFLLEGDYSIIPIGCFRAKLAHAHEDYEESDRQIQKVIDSLADCSSLLDVHDDIIDFALFLLNVGKLEEYRAAVEKIQAIIDEMGITKLKINIRRLQRLYYQKIGHQEGYFDICAHLCELEDVYQEENIRMIRSATRLRFNLEEAKRKEEKLVQEKLALMKKSETDALTGIANRYSLTTYTENIFEKAYAEQKSLGIEMVDIDFFKEYNDTYGHQAGDTALKAVADCLTAVAEKYDAYCARYGGDEFLLAYYDKTDDEILKIAAELKKKIRDLKIKHESSKVAKYLTVSQGIRNTVPVNGNKIWDYLFAADTALYHMKENGRNGIYLVHKMAAEGIDTVVIKESDGKENG